MQMVIDVLNCELLNVGGRHYRVVGGASVSGTSHSRVHANSYEPTVPQVAGDDEEYDEDDASAFEIQEEASDFVIRLAYDAEILPHLVGQKGKTKLKVEQDTGATISVPRKNSTALPGSREADVIVRASTTSAAVSAATRLELLVENMLNSNKCAACFGVVGGCTYQSPLIELFIGHAADWDTLTLSLSRSLTQAAFEHFKTSVTQDPRAATAQIEESIFVATKQIHLTVTMLKLYSEQKRHLAKQTLQSLQPIARNMLQQQPLQIQVKGLEYMNDDPSGMHVAYVGVHDPAQQQGSVQKLQQLCTAIVDAFADAGLLLSRDERPT
ncbi:A-kinase anchor protein 7 isoforms alpha and beta [Trebouxia sp. C0010 RCD-2024]